MLIKLGTAKADITPPSPVPLAGYASRRSVYDGVTRPLYLRVWLFEQSAAGGGERHKALLLQADLIYWSTERVRAMKLNIQAKWNIDPACVIFHASHTHGGPQTTDEFHPLLGLMSTDYIAALERTVEQLITEAHNNTEAVTIERGTGACEGIGINRRKNVDDAAAVMAPNPDGLNDTEVTTIRFMTANNRTKGLLFHFTCHPTTTSANWIHSDYCGYAMERLDEVFGDGVSCFLQGCCGDIRPLMTDETGEFCSGDDEDVRRFGTVLAEAVEEILHKPMTLLEAASIEGWTRPVKLAFEETPLDEFIGENTDGNEIVQIWKQMMEANRSRLLMNGIVLEMQLLKLAEGFSLLGMSGEMVVAYGLWVKRQSGGCVLPLGYSNGMVGYVSTAQQIKEGGYESVTSGYVFGYPGPFTADVETRVKDGLHELMEKLEASKK